MIQILLLLLTYGTIEIKGQPLCSCVEGEEVPDTDLCYACKSNSDTECLLFLYDTGKIDYNPVPEDGGECRPIGECSGEFMVGGGTEVDQGIDFCLIDNSCTNNECYECIDGSVELCKEGRCDSKKILLIADLKLFNERIGYCMLKQYCTGSNYYLSSDGAYCFGRKILIEAGCRGTNCTECDEETKTQCSRCLESSMFVNEDGSCAIKCSEYYWVVDNVKYCGSKCKDGFANVQGSMECTSCGTDCTQNCLRLSPYNDCYETCEEGTIPFKPSETSKVQCLVKTECLSSGNYLNLKESYCTYGTLK
jgi:hypothetical protein